MQPGEDAGRTGMRVGVVVSFWSLPSTFNVRAQRAARSTYDSLAVQLPTTGKEQPAAPPDVV